MKTVPTCDMCRHLPRHLYSRRAGLTTVRMGRPGCCQLVATPRGTVGGYHVSMGVWKESPAQHWLTSACHLDTAVGAARNRSPELGVRVWVSEQAL